MINLSLRVVKEKFNLKKLRKSIFRYLKNNKLRLFAIFLLVPIFIILYKIYIPRINEFGCFDDCNNFMRGYFVLQGKSLFSEVFSGHQPLGSYLSTVIQFITSPQNIFELVLRHRQFMLIFAFIMNVLIILRFGAKFIIFAVLFEFSKFYIFGDRFLGDGMIVYPLIYMTGLIFLKFKKQKVYLFDYILAAMFTWFMVFMRVPYVPVAMFSYLLFLWNWPVEKKAVISLVLFSVLSFVTLFTHNVSEYFYNVVYFNYQINLPAEASSNMFGPKFLHWFFYPIYIFFYGPMNLFKAFLIGINILFLILFINNLWNRKFKQALFIFVILGLSNIRTVVPGSIFYGAFHMLSWFALLIFITIELLFQERAKKLIFYSGISFLTVLFMSFILSSSYFGTQKVDTHKEFITHYGGYLQEGEVIKALSSPKDTLFIDGSDDLIYWVTGLNSSYKYSWYTSSMHMLDRYSNERIKMFKENPPTFYREYGYCKKKDDYVFPAYVLPEFVVKDYVRLYTENEPSCIYLRNDKLPEISDEQWNKAAEFRFYPPPDLN